MIVVSLFDESANMVLPWAKAGHKCHCFDLQNDYKFVSRPEWNGGSIIWHPSDLNDSRVWRTIIDLKPDIIFGFPPCTDLAVSGAKHFAKKAAANPDYRKEAMKLVYVGKAIAEKVGCPYMIENPVSVISSEWRKPDHIFHPFQYGGYVPMREAEHPRYPGIIPPRDAYTKKTCLWTGNGFKMPTPSPVSHQGVNHGWLKLGGKSARTKKIRSETPRGFAIAVMEANS